MEKASRNMKEEHDSTEYRGSRLMQEDGLWSLPPHKSLYSACITITSFFCVCVPNRSTAGKVFYNALSTGASHVHDSINLRVAREVCAIGEPCLNWQPDTDNKV